MILNHFFNYKKIKQIVLLLILLAGFTSVSTKTFDKKNKELILALEICGDSTILSCWDVMDQHMTATGFFIFDSIKGCINYKRGVFELLYARVPPDEIDTIKYLNLSEDRSNRFKNMGKFLISVDSMIQANMSSKNLITIEPKCKDDSFANFNQYLQKKKYPINYTRRSYGEFAPNMKFYLFKINCEFIEFPLRDEDNNVVEVRRTYALQSAKNPKCKPKLRSSKIPIYLITKIYSIEPYSISY